MALPCAQKSLPLISGRVGVSPLIRQLWGNYKTDNLLDKYTLSRR